MSYYACQNFPMIINYKFSMTYILPNVCVSNKKREELIYNNIINVSLKAFIFKLNIGINNDRHYFTVCKKCAYGL